MAAANIGAGAVDLGAHSEVEVYLRANNLPDMDFMSHSDGFAVLYLKTGRKGNFNEVGRTEYIKDERNPRWNARFRVRYEFEKEQWLSVQVFDADSNSRDLNKHDFIGQVEISLADLVAQRDGQVTKPLLRKDGSQMPRGTLVINAEEVKNNNRDRFFMRWSASKLPKMDFWGKADPYLKILMQTASGADWVPVHTTNTLMKTYSPQWEPFEKTAGEICNGDFSRPLRLQVWDWDKSGKDDLIGEVTTTLLALMTEGEGACFTLLKAKHGNKPRGLLLLAGFNRTVVPSFVDFLHSGMAMKLMVAIDFTGSNRAIHDPSSLHHRGVNPASGQPNQYVQAINSIGHIIANYTRNGSFKTWGFGAKLHATGAVSHCFSLTQDPNAEVVGVQGVLQAYWNAFNNLQLSGPTYFNEIISTAAMCAMPQKHDLSEYHVLLILTDGVINDFNQTVQAIIAASGLPLSIIIVGVGEADFQVMEALDSDGQLLKAGNKTALRDIVQFVAFREFIRGVDGADLAAAVLAEVPGQVEGYAAHHKVKPNL